MPALEQLNFHERNIVNKRSISRAAFGGLALATAASGLTVLVSGPASSAVTVPWTDPDKAGTITFYDASGTEVTSGNIGDPLPAYAVASSLPRSGDTRAALFAYTPTKSGSDWTPAGSWSGAQLTASAVFPTSGPSAVTSAPAAVATTGAQPLSAYINELPNTSGDATLSGAYELRLRTSGPGATTGTTYDVVDIVVNGSTWTVASAASGGSGAAATTTSLGASATSVTTGTAVTLTATLSPSAAVGTVQFSDGGSAVGAPVAVSGGVATTTVTPTTGSHSYSAAFTPTNPAAYAASSSGTVAVTATAPSSGGTGGTGGTPTPTPSPSPTPVVVSGITAPSKVKTSAKSLTLTLVETGTFTGTVKVFDGSKLIGTATVSNGKLTVKLKKKLKKGKHTIKVVFAGSSSASAFTKTVKVTVK